MEACDPVDMKQQLTATQYQIFIWVDLVVLILSRKHPTIPARGNPNPRRRTRMATAQPGQRRSLALPSNRDRYVHTLSHFVVIRATDSCGPDMYGRQVTIFVQWLQEIESSQFDHIKTSPKSATKPFSTSFVSDFKIKWIICTIMFSLLVFSFTQNSSLTSWSSVLCESDNVFKPTHDHA